MQRALRFHLVGASYARYSGAVDSATQPLLALAAACVASSAGRTRLFPPALRKLDWAILVLLIGVAAQATPLPRTLAVVLSPEASRLQDSLDLTARVAAPSPLSKLSIVPRHTLDALATVVLGVLAFLGARATFHAGGTRQFCKALALVGGFAAVAAVVQRALTPTLVLGLLEPSARSASPFGAFVNRNHFAAWLLMAAGPVIGYLVAHARSHSGYRGPAGASLRQGLMSGAVLFGMAVVAMIGVLLATLSRSALAALGVAGLFGLVATRARWTGMRSLVPLLVAAAGCIVLGLVAFVDVDGWATRLSQTVDINRGPDTGRLTIWRETLPVLRDFWLTGTGAGTYSDAMTVYQQTRIWIGSMGKWAHFNNAHSHYLQLAAEGGLLLALPAAIALASLVGLARTTLGGDRTEIFWIRAGAAAALVGVAAQSIWETALIMPANAVLCGVLCGLLLHERSAANGLPRSPARQAPGA